MHPTSFAGVRKMSGSAENGAAEIGRMRSAGGRRPRSGDIPTIVYFDHTAIMSGGEIALLNLITSLDRSRYTPVVVLGMDGPLAERLREADVEVHILPLYKDVASTRKDSLKSSSILRLGTGINSLRYSLRLARLLR